MNELQKYRESLMYLAGIIIVAVFLFQKIQPEFVRTIDLYKQIGTQKEVAGSISRQLSIAKEKVERKKIDEFYAKVKRSERLDNQIEAEIEAVKDIGFTLNPKAKIKELTPKIQHIAEYAHTASTRIKAYKDKLDIEKTKTKTKTDEVKKLNHDLRRFEEVDNLKHLSYMELMQLNTYVENKYQIEDRKEKEKNGNKYLPTPKPEHSVQSSSEKTVDRKIKPR